MNTFTKITALLSATLLSLAVTTPASASEIVVVKEASKLTKPAEEPRPVVAASDAAISFERVGVTSTRAVQAPVEIAPMATPQPTDIQVASVPTQAPAVQQPQTQVAPAPVAPVAPAIPSNGGLAGAALAQLGVAQDCTAMVENALRAIGSPVGDLGPAQFAQFGTQVGDIQAGDILIYPGHVAIAISPTEAVHGGLNGMNTAIAGVNVPSYPSQIVRVG